MEVCQYNVGIVDDEQPAINRVREAIQRLGNFNVVLETTEALKAMELLSNTSIQILFLDYHMPNINGLMIAEEAVEKGIAVVFISGDPLKAIEGYEINAVDFIQKPFTEFRISKALKRAISRIESEESKTPFPTKILIKESNKQSLIHIDVNEILYFTGANKYTEVITILGSKYLINTKLKTLEIRYGKRFLRIHRSYLINIAHIYRISGLSVEMIDHSELEVGRLYREQVLEYIVKHHLT